MDEQKVFCPNCRKKVPYYAEATPVQNTIKGKTITYSGLVARCEYCKEEVFVFEIEQLNFDLYYLARDEVW